MGCLHCICLVPGACKRGVAHVLFIMCLVAGRLGFAAMLTVPMQQTIWCQRKRRTHNEIYSQHTTFNDKRKSFMANQPQHSSQASNTATMRRQGPNQANHVGLVSCVFGFVCCVSRNHAAHLFSERHTHGSKVQCLHYGRWHVLSAVYMHLHVTCSAVTSSPFDHRHLHNMLIMR